MAVLMINSGMIKRMTCMKSYPFEVATRTLRTERGKAKTAIPVRNVASDVLFRRE